MKRLFLLLLIYPISSCSFFAPGEQAIFVDATLSGIFIENKTDDAVIFYLEAAQSGKASWRQYTHQSVTIAPKAYQLIRYDTIQHYEENDTVVVYAGPVKKQQAVWQKKFAVDTRFYTVWHMPENANRREWQNWPEMFVNGHRDAGLAE